MLKGALRILLHQTDLYHFIQNRYLQKETLISKLLSYITCRKFKYIQQSLYEDSELYYVRNHLRPSSEIN